METISQVYTTIDDINYHLSNVFATYPTLYANHDSLSLYLQVIAPLIKNSREFCEYVKGGKMGLGTATGVGGFSQAGPFKIHIDGQNKIPMTSGVSFAPDGSWSPYFMQTFSKTSHKPAELSIRSIRHRDSDPDIIISSDPVHEAIVGALGSHLFDIGVAPSFMKYLGLYVCNERYNVKISMGPPKNEVYAKPYFIFEKSDVEMYKFLGSELSDERAAPDAFSQTTPYDYMIWLTQLAHTQFVGKYYFGITHIDLHTKNVMLTYVKNTDRAIKWGKRSPTPLMYGKTNLSVAPYYVYEMPFKVDGFGNILSDGSEGLTAKIIVENNGFLPKEIDFGLTVANLKESVVAKQQSLAFVNEPETYDKPVMGYSAVTQVDKGDIDYNFMTLNLAFRMARAIKIDAVGYENQKDHYKKLWEGLYPFLKDTLPSQFDPGNIDSGGPVISGKNSSGDAINMKLFGEFGAQTGYAYHLRARAVGTTTEIDLPLKKIWNSLKSHTLYNGSSRHFIDQGVMYMQLSRDNKPFIEALGVKFTSLPYVTVPYYSNPKFNNLQKFIKYNFALWRACIPMGKNMTQHEIDEVANQVDKNLVGKNSVEFCNIIDQEIIKHDPNKRKPIPFFTNIVTLNSDIWNLATSMLKSNITESLLEKAGFSRGKAKNMQLFTLRFNPDQTEMSRIANKETFKFNEAQRATNYQPPPNIGDYMKMVNVHLLYMTHVNGRNSFVITAERNKDLYKSAKNRLQPFESGVSINGGYFIVAGNYTDQLNYWLNKTYQGMPIGYFFSDKTSEFNGTSLPIPRAYQDMFATIYVSADGNLNVERSIDFLNRHEKTKGIVLYTLNDRTPHVNYAVERSVIKMEVVNGIKIPILNDANKQFFYKSAFEAGPILIWNGKIIFTRERMEKSMFMIDMTKDIPVSKYPNDMPNIKANQFETYKVVTTAVNSKMYFNEPGETNFPYGQRHSNSLMIHNVLCQTYDGKTLFVFVEGRGFDAVGLDRAQLAELISRFNVKNAVSLDGGFSANAVLKNLNENEHGYYWLLNDPDKRELSSTIHFGEF